jgi:acetyl esterase/lipase
VAAFVLKYRLNPFFGDDGPDEVAEPMPHPRDAVAMRAWLQRLAGRAPDLGTADAEQAIRVLRKQSDAWGIDPERIGIIGFSAGGTIATQAAATSDPTARPNFVVNIYGAYCNREVPPQAPPYFGVVAADDELCLGFFLDTTRQWLDAGAPTEFHVYETGGHGFGLVPQGTPVDTWTDRLEDWLAARGVLVHGTVAAARS